MVSLDKNRHDKLAPYWATGLVVLCGTGKETQEKS